MGMGTELLGPAAAMGVDEDVKMDEDTTAAATGTPTAGADEAATTGAASVMPSEGAVGAVAGAAEEAFALPLPLGSFFVGLGPLLEALVDAAAASAGNGLGAAFCSAATGELTAGGATTARFDLGPVGNGRPPLPLTGWKAGLEDVPAVASVCEWWAGELEAADGAGEGREEGPVAGAVWGMEALGPVGRAGDEMEEEMTGRVYGAEEDEARGPVGMEGGLAGGCACGGGGGGIVAAKGVAVGEGAGDVGAGEGARELAGVAFFFLKLGSLGGSGGGEGMGVDEALEVVSVLETARFGLLNRSLMVGRGAAKG